VSDLQQKNRKTFAIMLGVATAMVVLSFASVPLYRLLCQATGWGGRTQTVTLNTSKVYNREFIIQFNADTDPHLPWSFKPDQRNVKVKVGQNAIISYTAENRGKLPIAGTAIHNVTPLKAGQYFTKTQCFCFGQQILQPGQKVHMPVTFFIDPKIMDDRELRNLKTITLSYTFYRHDSPELEKAVKKYEDESSSSSAKIN
jgi:cytochrome c oxidase assembly protein subunit 11